MHIQKLENQKSYGSGIFKVGEFDRAIFLLDDWQVNRNNLSENDKFELYVGAGDLRIPFTSLLLYKAIMKNFKFR